MCYEAVVGKSSPQIKVEFMLAHSSRSKPLVVTSIELQFMCFVLILPANKTGNSQLRNSVKSDSIKGCVGDRWATTSFTGLTASIRCMVVASRWCRPETGAA